MGLRAFKMAIERGVRFYALFFLILLFKDWRKKVEKMNAAVAASKAKCRPFTDTEFLTGLAIFIGAEVFAKRGSDLFSGERPVGGRKRQ